MTGPIITELGIPASLNARIASSLRGGVAARSYRERNLRQPLFSHARQDVDVTHHEGGFRYDPYGVIVSFQDFENFAHDAPLLLDRLVGVRVGADCDRLRLVSLLRQFLFEKARGIGLGKQLRFEIEPGGKTHITVRGPCEAIDAAMLAAAIRVDRAIEGNIGRFVARYDRARLFDLYVGLERRQFLERVPAIVEDIALVLLVAPARIDARPAAPAPVRNDPQATFLDHGIRHMRISAHESGNVSLSDLFHLALLPAIPGMSIRR
jgi:hypothetical protein